MTDHSAEQPGAVTPEAEPSARDAGIDASPGRSIELSVEVMGTPEEVWEAIATGPGITSWYVPHTVEPRTGGAAHASFGPEPEMQIPGRAAAWEPPHRIVFDGGEGAGGMAFEWLVEARDGGRCVVRLVNSGFGSGADWDAQYDGMAEGWKLFLFNLQLHLEHFRGRTATPMLPMASWPGPRERTWADLTGALGIPARPEVGSMVTLVPADGLRCAAPSWSATTGAWRCSWRSPRRAPPSWPPRATASTSACRCGRTSTARRVPPPSPGTSPAGAAG
ncbi:MAG: SRPBCC domain-containing protein [Acidimicrobiales bacterium]